MSLWSRLRIKSKLMLVFSIILFLTCIISLIAVRALFASTEVAGEVKNLVDTRFEMTLSINNVRSSKLLSMSSTPTWISLTP